MQFVKLFARLLDKSVSAKIARAEKRNQISQKAFQKAKGQMQQSQNELQMAEAETLIQLKKLDDTRDTILQKAALNAKRVKAIDRVIETDA
jgi:hypothetical protein